MFDIIYSYTVHEAPDVILDTLRNLYYYNRNFNIAVVLGPNQYMYDNLQDKISEFKNCHLSNPFPKNTYNISLAMGHIRNFQYCQEQNIISRDFIIMASTSYFHREMTSDFLGGKPEIPEYIVEEGNLRWVWWKGIYANNKIRGVLRDHGISKIYGHWHEGLTMKYSTIKFVSDIDNKFHFDENVESPFLTFEEYIFPSACMHLEGKIRTICYMHSGGKAYPTPDFLHTIQKPCYKRIETKLDAPVRVWLKNITNNYSN